MSIGSVETINTTNEGWVWPYNESASVRSGPCYGGSSLHAGIDINFTSPGVSAIAAHDGKVVRVSPNSGAAGNFVMIKINDNLYYNYQHLNSISVNEGDVVKAGSTIIGEVGTTGNTEVSANTKGHLHFGVSTSQDFGSYGNVASSKDPLNYLPSGAPGGYVCN
jgi:murein DD-endopeptidase MepM/ murein hydrolase activator NlpD